MRRTLVIRFGSLGDVCLLGWSLAARRDRDRPLTLVTKSAFAGLMRHFPGIDEVVALPSGRFASLVKLARHLGATDWETVLDAHNILRSHLVTLMMGRRPRRRLKKDTTARLRLLRGTSKPDRSLTRTMADRFDEVIDSRSGDLATAPLAHLAEGPQTALGIAPGAQWDTKRWPEASFASVLEGFAAGNEAPIKVFLGPRESRWWQGSRLAAACDRLGRVQIHADLDLVELAGELAGCRAVLTNDSGLMHLAEAAGTPVVAFFGPTVREFGYFPRLTASRVLEQELGCRPCSRNGKRSCHWKDLACLTRIGPEEVLTQLQEYGPW